MTSFFAKLCEMSERFDPRYIAFKRRSADFRYPAVRLSELLSAPPESGSGEAGLDRTDIAQPRYIRITDIDEDGELRSGLGATAETIESKYLLQDGDLLFARSGATVGKCYLHNAARTPEPCIYAGYMIRFRFNEKILPKFVFAFAQTSYYRDWVLAIQRSAGQPNINAQEYCSLEIPLPPREVQERIVAELDAAYAAKRKADKKAAELLASIDDFVLDALGIPPLPPPDTSLPARIFTVSSRDVADDRLDPYYYQRSFRITAKTITKDARLTRLGSVGTFVRGVTYSAEDEAPDGFAILRASNVKLETGEIDLSDLLYVRKELVFDDSQLVKQGDILICAASGSKEHAGKVAYVEPDLKDTYIGGFMTVLRVNKTIVNPRYAAVYMQSQLFRRLILRHLGGTNINNVSLSLLNSLPILIPERSVQEEIVARVSAIRTEARTLKAEAVANLVAAKSCIEKQLLT